MIRNLASGLNETFGLRRRLIAGFAVLIFLTVVANLAVIGTLMRERIFRGTDTSLRRQAGILRGILLNEEKITADEASMAVNLQGMGEALAGEDKAQLKRLLIPMMISEELTSIYVVYADRRAVLLMGEPMAAETRLATTRLVERGFSFLSASGMLELDGTLWIGAAAAHRGADGKPDALVVLGKRVDTDYLQSLSDLVGPEVAFAWGNGVAYSLDPIPPELAPAQLRASRADLAEYREDAHAFRSVNIGDLSHRVVAFDFSSRNGRPLVGYLFQPTARLDNSMQTAVFQVIGVGLAVTLLGLAFAFLYVHSVTRPLENLEHAARTIALGDLDRPVRVESRDGIGQLAQVFEDMRKSLREMMEKQERWNADLETQVRDKTEEMSRLSQLRDQLLRRMLTTQEEERRRIARELHDETSQALTGLKVHLATTEMELTGEARAEIAEANKRTGDILQEVNRIVLDLRPTLLDDYGLEAALSWYANSRMEKTGTRVEMVTSGTDLRLSPTVETILFRIGQEAISNAAKYAGANNLRVSLLVEPDAKPPVVSLHVEDDGRGFDAGTAGAHWAAGRPSFGLMGMQERIELVGGKLEIRSTPGQGTQVIATVPLALAVEEKSA